MGMLGASCIETAPVQINPEQSIIGRTGTVTWTNDKTYILGGFVYVGDGDVLTIEAGTVIKGVPGSGENASALVVARGGKIMAEGTPNQPIIFTALADELTRSDDLPPYARGLWGGVIICGRATINTASGVESLEGLPSTASYGLYGGNDDADNSGVLRYVSIRHGGSEIGANNEINGLTLGAVGSGTVIDHVEVFANLDDGIEWFGGAAQASHLSVAFVGDDAFDYDEGFHGKGQFWYSQQWEDAGDRAGEHDGGTEPEDGAPFAIPTIYNATYIGNGSGDRCLYFRDNAGGKYYNSVFMNFESAVKVEDLSSGEDSRARLEAGDLVLQHNIWDGFGSLTGEDFVEAYLLDAANANTLVNPGLVDADISDRTIDPRPTMGSAAATAEVAIPTDAFFKPVNYAGAFSVGDTWADWTYLKTSGLLK